jgi:hypothetical protein
MHSRNVDLFLMQGQLYFHLYLITDKVRSLKALALITPFRNETLVTES